MSQEVPDHFRWLYGGDMHDPQDYADRWHEDAVVNQAADIPGTDGRFEGWDGFSRMLAELESAAPGLTFEPVRVIDLPEPGRHLVLIEATGTGVGSGIPISGRIAHLVTLDGGRIRQIDAFARIPLEMELAHVLTLRDGWAASVVEYSDRNEALEAMGLSGPR